MRTNLALALVCLLIMSACGTFYTGVVSLTAVVEDAAKSYAKLYNDGLVPADVAAKASLAHAEYRKAAGVLADALEAVKLGKTADTKAALEAARTAAYNFVDAIFSVLGKQRAATVRAQIAKAGAP